MHSISDETMQCHAAMTDLKHIINKLTNLKYLQALLGEKCVINTKTLENGKCVGKNLIEEWLKSNECVDRTYISDIKYTLNSANTSLHINSDEIIKTLLKLREASVLFSPLVLKKQINISGSFNNNVHFLKFCKYQQQTKLVSDYIIKSSYGLQHFSCIQRLRKIWWMRYITNPGRCNLGPRSEKGSRGDTLSVTIKSIFPFAELDIEDITFIPLKEISKFSNKYFLLDEHTGNMVQPSVVRSTIHLETATCALLLDACINTRKDTLSLNKKLVPYQCLIVCSCSETLSSDMKDLHSHISSVICNAGIRMYKKKEVTISCRMQLDVDFSVLDDIGIPYAIILEDQSLHTGILKLRSRDTSLQETIHISDLPVYLLQLLNC